MVPARLNRRARVDPAIGDLLCGVIDLGFCDSWRKASRYTLLRD